ncbi:MAG: anti-sigma B factor antagonist [Marivirga sp.]|jgi:anti-sigma B factor antagonist
MIKIDTYKEDTVDYLTIEGDVDASSSIHLDEALTKLVDDASATAILIDCGSLAYISSAGLGVFMSYIDLFKEKQIQMVIYGLSEKVFNVFQILGLDQLLNITSDKEEAKKKIHEIQS